MDPTKNENSGWGKPSNDKLKGWGKETKSTPGEWLSPHTCESVGVTFESAAAVSISGVSSIAKLTNKATKDPNVAVISLGGKSSVNYENLDVTPQLKNFTRTASTVKSVI